MAREWIISSTWIFRVCDFSRVYEVLNFMLEADTGVCGVSKDLVEVAVTIRVITWAIQVWCFRICDRSK